MSEPLQHRCRSPYVNAYRDSPRHRVAAGEDAAVGRAGARSDDPFGRGRCVIGAFQRLAHVMRHRARHQEHVGVPGRGDETEAEPLEIVEGVAQRVELELAAVAGAGVDMPDGETPSERPLGGLPDRRRECGELPDRRFPARLPSPAAGGPAAACCACHTLSALSAWDHKGCLSRRRPPAPLAGAGWGGGSR